MELHSSFLLKQCICWAIELLCDMKSIVAATLLSIGIKQEASSPKALKKPAQAALDAPEDPPSGQVDIHALQDTIARLQAQLDGNDDASKIESKSADDDADRLFQAAEVKEEPRDKPLPLPAGLTKVEFHEKKVRRKKWAAFVRSMDAGANERGLRTEKCPDEIMVQCLGIHEKNYFFQLWLNNSESWGKVMLTEEHWKMEKAVESQRFRWLTESQMEDFYKDAGVAAEMKAMKSQNPKLFRPHPELPHFKKAVQYKCLIEDDQWNQLEQVLKQGMKLEASVSGDAANMLVRKQLGETSTALGRETAAPASASMPCQPSQLQTDIGGATDSAPAETPKLKRALEMVADQEEKEKKRLVRQQDKKREADLLKETSGFKGKAWVSLCDGLLKKLADATNRCKSIEKGSKIVTDCQMPANLAKEYIATFVKDARLMKKLKDALCAAMSGHDEQSVFEEMKSAKATTDAVKNNLSIFKGLDRRYAKDMK